MAVVGIHVLLCGPSELTVINDIIRAVLRAKRIDRNKRAIGIIASYTEADVTNDEVLRTTAVDFVMRYDNSNTWCCLSGDGIVLAVNTQIFDQLNLARYSKAHRQRLIGILLDRPAERAFCLALCIIL